MSGEAGIAASFLFVSNTLFISLSNVIRILVSVVIVKLTKPKPTIRPKEILYTCF